LETDPSVIERIKKINDESIKSKVKISKVIRATREVFNYDLMEYETVENDDSSVPDNSYSTPPINPNRNEGKTVSEFHPISNPLISSNNNKSLLLLQKQKINTNIYVDMGVLSNSEPKPLKVAYSNHNPLGLPMFLGWASTPGMYKNYLYIFIYIYAYSYIYVYT
jgi:hypothetical protein